MLSPGDIEVSWGHVKSIRSYLKRLPVDKCPSFAATLPSSLEDRHSVRTQPILHILEFAVAPKQ